MAIIGLPPNFAFTGIPKFGLQRRSSTLRSRYTGAGQYVVFPYAVWLLEGNLVEYDGMDAAELRAFLVDLEGPKNTFRLPVPGFSTSITGYTADRAVYQAEAARSTSLIVTGGALGFGYLHRGDFITVNDELKMVTNSPSFHPVTGRASVQFKPGLRLALVGGEIVKCFQPTVLLRALEDDIAMISLQPPVRQGVPNFSVAEAVDI